MRTAAKRYYILLLHYTAAYLSYIPRSILSACRYCSVPQMTGLTVAGNAEHLSLVSRTDSAVPVACALTVTRSANGSSRVKTARCSVMLKILYSSECLLRIGRSMMQLQTMAVGSFSSRLYLYPISIFY